MFLRSTLAALLATLSLAAFAGVDVNKASQAELEALRGVGPQLSSRILAERQKGAFKDWPDMIKRVQGVGPGSAAKLSQAGLTVGDATYQAAAKASAAKPVQAPTAAAKPMSAKATDTKPAPAK